MKRMRFAPILITIACLGCSEQTGNTGPAGPVFTGSDGQILTTQPDSTTKPPLQDCAEDEREVIGSNGPMCVAPCDSGKCPEGLECHTLTDEAGNPASFCIEPHGNLCQPCTADHQCNPATSATQNRCISLGNEGSFCGGHCDENGTQCPTGYSCTEFTGDDDETYRQCMPDSQQCQCSSYSISIGAKTNCANENASGSCIGERICSAGGLSACNAPVPQEEVCNEKDDNCDGQIDEGVAAPCGGCEDSCVLAYVPGEKEILGTHQEPEKQENTQKIEDTENPFIWIANSGENTVSRLNTQTGCEEARYYVCGDPSRTAVALDGSGIVGCRSGGGVYRISVAEAYCIDKNGNGTIETSRDTNEDCKITPDEMIQDDECIVWKVQPGGSCTRAAGVDADGHVWVGMWNTKQLHRLDFETGATLKSIPISTRPYGLAIDSEGLIWIASRDPNGGVSMVHPEDGELNTFQSPAGENYGLAVDPFGGIWFATGWSGGGGIARFDKVTQQWQVFSHNQYGATRGVAVKLDTDGTGQVVGGRVYTAHSGSGHVTVVDAITQQMLPVISVGGNQGPVGVAIDSDGHLWTVNQNSNSATRINTETNAIMGNYPVGSNPYTYSDMTGYALKTIVAIEGHLKHVFEGWGNGTTFWENLNVVAEMHPDYNYMEISYRYAEDKETLKAKDWIGPFGPFPPAEFPMALNVKGRLLEVKVSLYSMSLGAIPQLKGIQIKAIKQ